MTVERKDYLNTLAVVAVLLVSEIDNEGDSYSYSEPLWMATFTAWTSQISWFSFLLCILGAMTSNLIAAISSRRMLVTSPTVWFVIGFLLYLTEMIIDYQVQAYHLGTAEWPKDYNDAFFMSNAVPVYIFLVVWPLYTLWLFCMAPRRVLHDHLQRGGDELSRETEWMPFALRGVDASAGTATRVPFRQPREFARCHHHHVSQSVP
jgi:hypothetical protein